MWVLLSRFFLNEGRPNQPHSFAELYPGVCHSCGKPVMPFPVGFSHVEGKREKIVKCSPSHKDCCPTYLAPCLP